MNALMMVEVIRDASALLALALIIDVVTTRFPLRGHRYRSVLAGLAVGLLAIGVMAVEYNMRAGVVFDARSVLMAVSGLALGGGATVIAMAVASAYRLQMGGAGAITGVLVIVSSGAIGVAWHAWRRGDIENIRIAEFYALGLVVHGVMLVLMLTLPSGLSGPVLTSVALPVLVVFPVATAVLASFMANRLKAERLGARLGASETRYRSLFENNHAVMLVIDPTDGRIVDANPAASRFYGWSWAELTARSISDINALPEEEVRAEMRRAQDGERTFFRFRHRLATGEIRDVEVMSGEVVVDGRAFLYSIIHDVTSERQATEALRLRSAALEAAASAIMIADRDGTIEWVNPAFSELYGYPPEEVVGRNPRELVKSGVQGPEFYHEMWRVLLAGETWSGSITNRRKDGTHFEADMAITPLRDATGEITHYIAVKQDLTDWRELEQRLAVAQKLESVGQLAGGVAHDFNNLLTVINGTLDLVLSDLPAEHELRDDLEEVRRGGQRASALTRQLLAFGRRLVLRKESLDLNDLILDMNRMLRRLIDEDIRIVTDLSADTGSVFADRGQLEQVIANLAVNARDAMPTGGTLTITTDSPGPSHARLTVRDTGMGIDPSIRARIFDPFFTTKETGKGTGLGLATVYGIVVQSGGEIRVDSTIGEGTTFEVLLPRGTATAAPATPTEPPAPATGSETILVVEDEAAIRNLVGRILGRAGYNVLIADGGTEALELLSEHGDDVNLLFTDVVMPEMSGPTLLERAMELQPRLKVLFASGHAGDTLTERGVTADAHHFLEKPYTVTSLAEKVRGVLDA